MKLLPLPRLQLLPLPRLQLLLMLLRSLGMERLVARVCLRSHPGIPTILRLQALDRVRREAGACPVSRLITTPLLP